MSGRLFRRRPTAGRLLLAAIVAVATLGGIFGDASAGGPWLPENISSIGEQVDHLYRVIFVVTVVMFILTEGALFYFVFRYRRRPGRSASYVHESSAAEALWSVIPGLILLFLAIYQWNAWADAKLREPTEAGAVRVEVFAKQFEWHFRYPGPDGRFATDDDVTMINQFHVPDGKWVIAQMRAEDVIHSFFLPNLRVKQDIVPGNTIRIWFDANKIGTYEIACAELCGLGHYRMRAQLFVHPQDEYDAWLTAKYDEGASGEDWGWDWKEGL